MENARLSYDVGAKTWCYRRGTGAFDYRRGVVRELDDRLKMLGDGAIFLRATSKTPEIFATDLEPVKDTILSSLPKKIALKHETQSFLLQFHRTFIFSATAGMKISFFRFSTPRISSSCFSKKRRKTRTDAGHLKISLMKAESDFRRTTRLENPAEPFRLALNERLRAHAEKFHSKKLREPLNFR